jgi:hypothetical protein
MSATQSEIAIRQAVSDGILRLLGRRRPVCSRLRVGSAVARNRSGEGVAAMTESEERDPDSQEARTREGGEQEEAGTEDDRSEGKGGEAGGASQGVPQMPVEPPTHEEA